MFLYKEQLDQPAHVSVELKQPGEQLIGSSFPISVTGVVDRYPDQSAAAGQKKRWMPSTQDVLRTDLRMQTDHQDPGSVTVCGAGK